MNLLALDASTEACTVAITTSAGDIFEAFEVAPRKHTELIPQMLDSVLAQSALKKNQIEGCIVGIGPGAFTGIRIGIATMQGIALGLNVPCYAVSSLHAIAQQALILQPSLSGVLLATIDARMDEIYCAKYEIINGENEAPKQAKLIGEEKLVGNKALIIEPSISAIAGSGISCVKEQLETQADLIQIEECYPTGSSLLAIFQQHELTPVAPEKLQACYIRNQVTHQNKAK